MTMVSKFNLSSNNCNRKNKKMHNFLQRFVIWEFQ